MNTTIRPATIRDYKKVIALFGEFVENPQRYAKFDNDSYADFLNREESFLDIVDVDQKIVGFITYSIRTVIRYPKPIIEVEELFVDTDFRRQGLGKKLIKHVLEFAKENNCEYVFLASSKEREPAHKFYKSMGFDEYALHFRRKP